MEKTPLELYETAYKLHYVESRILEAVKYYEALIKEFPDSNECGYAAIQIQKIKAGNLAKELKKSPKPNHPLTYFALIISIISLAAAVFAGFHFFDLLEKGELRVRLTIGALGKMYRGEDDEALKALTELKILAKDDITPFELSADIYRKRHQFEQARSEYELFFKLNPDRQPTEGELTMMNQEKRMRSAQRQAVVNQNTSDQQPTNIISKPKPVSTTTRAKPKKRPSTQSPQKPKGLFLVDPDSISYF